MKLFPILVFMPLSLICVKQAAEAVTPLSSSLEQRVESSDYVFIGIAYKIRVIKIQPNSVYSTGKKSSQMILPAPPGLYRRVEVDVRRAEVLKAGKKQLPCKLTVTKTKVYLNQHDLQQSVAEMTRTLRRKKRIYLVVRGQYFSTESISEKSKVKNLITNPPERHRVFIP